MFCSYCGKEIAEGAAFCDGCGKATAVQDVPVEEAPATVMAGETTVLSENMIPPVQQEGHAMQPDAVFPTEEPVPAVEMVPAPKKRRFPLKWLIAAVVAVAAVVALLLNMSTIVGTVIKTFGSDTDYYKYVELKTVKSGTDTVADYYALIKESFTDNEKKVQGSFRPVLGEDAKELLQDYLPAEMKLDWLNDLKISYTGNYKDNVLLFELAVAVADGDPLKAIAILNSTDGKVFAALPSVSDTYLEFGMNDATAPETDGDGMAVAPPVMSTNSLLGEWLTDPELADDLREVLPTDKELDKLLDRYLALVLDMVEVSASKDTTLSIEGVEQTCTESTITITQKQCSDILIAVLNEAKTDKDIKAIIADVQKLVEERVEGEEIDLYDAYTKALDEALTSLKDAENEATNETFAAMTTYISKQHEIIGRRITVAGTEVLYYATAQKGSAFATEMTVGNAAKLSGKGTKKGDVVSGEYDVDVQGTVVAKLTVKDFDEGKAEDGYLNGTFRITPKKALFEMMGMDEDAALMIGTYDPSLEFVMKNSKNASEMAINLYKDESLLFGLVSEGKTSKADKVEIPENTVDGTDEEALMNWLEQIEGDTVEEKLRSIGVPEEIMDVLELLLGSSSESVTARPNVY
ncbi:MAG: zinc ribbon domain-containing protein [Ruminococcaceae bacterium]|nr:zinc ribbon domain-containing protein [Oscillospiraceae bacterium]